jgi:hypothetical protein
MRHYINGLKLVRVKEVSLQLKCLSSNFGKYNYIVLLVRVKAYLQIHSFYIFTTSINTILQKNSINPSNPILCISEKAENYAEKIRGNLAETEAG